MLIADLPLELFHEILRRSIEVRGLRRGMRLRLANSMCTKLSHHVTPFDHLVELFAKEIIQAIFAFQLLEHYFSTKCNEDTVLPAFTAAYLSCRVANEPLGGIQPLVQIRRVAQRLCLESNDGRTVQDYIKDLSTVVVKHSSLPPHTQACRPTDWLWKANEVVKYENDFETDVYIAALSKNSMDTVTKCLARIPRSGYGEVNASFSRLFGTARSHAVALGDRHNLAAFMFSPDKYLSQKLRLNILSSVAAYGDAYLFQFVFNFDA
jgi:hypothetical protein